MPTTANFTMGNLPTDFLTPLSVEQISHAPFKNKDGTGHSGTGIYSRMRWETINSGTVAAPPSVPLISFTATAVVRCYFFKTVDPSIRPSHFAAAASPNVIDFGNANIFFHPNPAHAEMREADYPVHGNWASLFRYAPINGVQLSQAGKDQIFIMPYVPAGIFKTTGSFASNWATIATDIAKLIKLDINGVVDDSLTINNVVVSSFSYGIEASDAFRSRAAGLAPLLREIWDLDGMFSSARHISRILRSAQKPKLTQYQQFLPNFAGSFFVGPLRWTHLSPLVTRLMKTNLQAARKEVHRLIGQTLFFHACDTSTVG